MVFLPGDVLGWQPLAASWLDSYLAAHHAACQHQEQQPKQQPAEQPEQPRACTRGSPSKVPHAGVPSELHPLRAFLWGLFEQFVPPLLDWVAVKGVLAVPVGPSASLAALTTMLGMQITAAVGCVVGGCG